MNRADGRPGSILTRVSGASASTRRRPCASRVENLHGISTIAPRKVVRCRNATTLDTWAACRVLWSCPDGTGCPCPGSRLAGALTGATIGATPQSRSAAPAPPCDARTRGRCARRCPRTGPERSGGRTAGTGRRPEPGARWGPGARQHPGGIRAEPGRAGGRKSREGVWGTGALTPSPQDRGDPLSNAARAHWRLAAAVGDAARCRLSSNDFAPRLARAPRSRRCHARQSA